MVNIKSLRIGSHVAICGGERVKVTAIRSNGIITTTLGDMDESNLTPVPLKPELLKELGFESVNKGFGKPWRRGDFAIYNKWDSEYWSLETGIRINIRFLHELEARYYEIFGEELIKD